MSEGTSLSKYHAYLILDGSGSMSNKERDSGKEKHLVIAEMVQELIDTLHDDPEMEDVFLSVYSFDEKGTKPHCEDYDVKADTYYQKTEYSRWDPLLGHGGGTPIGEALDFARLRAEKWVESARGQEQHRAIIYLMSDGQNNLGRSPMDIRNELTNFQSPKGRVRLATVGYFQFREGEPGETDDEKNGRTLLKQLPLNEKAYFESANGKAILGYIKRTIQVLG
ncbi:MAG: vWA domain-containing protein [Aggregatilineales bacterium]